MYEYFTGSGEVRKEMVCSGRAYSATITELDHSVPFENTRLL
jgi:hypothetical protein